MPRSLPSPAMPPEAIWIVLALLTIAERIAAAGDRLRGAVVEAKLVTPNWLEISGDGEPRDVLRAALRSPSCRIWLGAAPLLRASTASEPASRGGIDAVVVAGDGEHDVVVGLAGVVVLRHLVDPVAEADAG